MCFTNATLIDEAFAQQMLRVKNFIPAISVEGFEQATDSRRACSCGRPGCAYTSVPAVPGRASARARRHCPPACSGSTRGCISTSTPAASPWCAGTTSLPFATSTATANFCASPTPHSSTRGVHVPVGVDVEIPPSPGDAAPHILPVVLEVDDKQRLALAVGPDARIHLFPLFPSATATPPPGTGRPSGCGPAGAAARAANSIVRGKRRQAERRKAGTDQTNRAPP